MPTYSEYYYRIIIKIKQFEFIYLICIFCSLGTFESLKWTQNKMNINSGGSSNTTSKRTSKWNSEIFSDKNVRCKSVLFIYVFFFLLLIFLFGISLLFIVLSGIQEGSAPQYVHVWLTSVSVGYSFRFFLFVRRWFVPNNPEVNSFEYVQVVNMLILICCFCIFEITLPVSVSLARFGLATWNVDSIIKYHNKIINKD